MDFAARRDLALPADLNASDLPVPAPDLSELPDSGPILDTSVGKYFAGQNCQPVVPSDPVSAFIDVFFINKGNAPSEPIHIYGGHIVDDKTGNDVISFDVKPINDFVVPANGSLFQEMNKAAGTAQPANGCNTLQCNSLVRVAVDWGAPGGQPTRSTQSLPIAVMCTF